ncbi:DUF4168 domain-containing protein [Marinoscillum sp.]|uniref:DUF4168 domain-containing protein n=1 Tax=Marinoscillum sp. TaxID=2024838 RepID=UPI003BA9266F
MNYSKTTSVATLFLAFCLIGNASFGQQTAQNMEFSDKQYDQFVDINIEIIPLQQSAQKDMMQLISDGGMEAQRFQQLAQAQQSGTLKDVANGADEIATFNQVGQQVMEVQQEMRQDIQQTISESGMSLQTFQQFSMAYNQDQEVRSKVDELLAAEMKGN